MKRSSGIARATALALGAAATAAFGGVDLSQLPPPATKSVDFDADIKPIFEQSCFQCHGPERPKSGFRLDNRDSALKGGDGGQDIIPGDSAGSALISYVARLDPEMGMPPDGKGDPLTREQVALLRAWIDQGANWGKATAPRLNVSVAPAVGYVTVQGNEAKFRQQWWIRDGWRGGVESFDLLEQLSPETRVTLKGRALTDDYRMELLAEQQRRGFLRFGFEQFRKYDSDTGGYYPDFSQPTISLDRNLHLDIGRAWFDAGLTLPDWPRIVLGYEYQWKEGTKSMLNWGPVTDGFEADGVTPRKRNIYPAFKTVDERTHVLKLDFDFERSGWRIEDSFRGEWADLGTRRNYVIGFTSGTTNIDTQTVREGQQSFQGANTIRVQRQFNDWWYGSAGYLYSHLEADADFSVESVYSSGFGFGQSAPRIELERESHVANLNSSLGPWEGFTLGLGVQSEWTSQSGLSFPVPPPANGVPTPPDYLGDIDRAVVSESVTLRFTRLPFTTLFAEARLQQESIGQREEFQFSTTTRDTDASSDTRDLRAGFSTSPWTWLTFGSQYRYYGKETTYDDGNPTPDFNGYPTLIKSRDLVTKELESRLVLRPRSWLKTTLTHRLVATDYHTAIESYSAFYFDPVASESYTVPVPGGRLYVGNYDSQIWSLNTSLSPIRRLYTSVALSYQDLRSSSSVARNDNTAPVVPYQGDIYTVFCLGRYVLSEKTDLTASYSFSTADFCQRNFPGGLPVGVDYDLHGAQAGIETRLSKSVNAKLQYGFYRYREPSSGGVNDYTAHAIFASLNWRIQ